MVGFLIGLANVLMVITSLFLICLVLIQRGKGGGLAGAFGGAGGSSAFGTKAGDVFTRVTIYVAIVWFILAMLLVLSSNSSPKGSAFSRGLSGTSPSSTAPDGADPIKPDGGGKKAVPLDPTTDAPAKPAADAPAKPSEEKPANADIKPTGEAAPPAKKTP